ncbi:MAG: hypothetical protein V3S06_05920 [candidate division Zixibacteria bacterium]
MQLKKPEKITIRKSPCPGGKYVIKIEGRVTWEGKNPQEKLPRVLNAHPGKNVSIAWKPDEGFLIV